MQVFVCHYREKKLCLLKYHHTLSQTSRYGHILFHTHGSKDSEDHTTFFILTCKTWKK